ncbi:unnamed protein product [Cylicostephanus goldi]|uniref:Uncharacterized protein n=1 Tax=Cylicostephanus goldi TaxID=71465 RepID=A0A3P6RBE8_CYLGO|nr:unnamed protein product [Cylicostephanus goldi]
MEETYKGRERLRFFCLYIHFRLFQAFFFPQAADEAVTDFLPADDVLYACSSPSFSQETTPLSLGVNSYAIPSTEIHNQTKNRNGQTKHTSGLTFHPYRRLNTECTTPAGERAEQIPTMQTFDNVMDMTTVGKPEHYEEEPPSDPDDSVVEDANDQIQTK